MRQELERLLDTHRAQRPEMQPQDYYKLLYQREFGCGHTAPAPETAEPLSVIPLLQPLAQFATAGLNLRL